jgi:hypothetical protein
MLKGILRYLRSEEERKTINLKESLKSAFKPKYLGFSLISTAYVLIIFLVFTYFYPFAFTFPSNIGDFFLALSAYPIYLAVEILYREVIYPQLELIYARKWRTRITIIIAIPVQVILFVLTSNLAFIPAILMTHGVFLLMIIVNTLVYERTEEFSSVILSSFIIIQVFLSAFLSTAFGIDAMLQYFI